MPRQGSYQGPRNGANTIWNNLPNGGNAGAGSGSGGGGGGGGGGRNNHKYNDHDDRSERQQSGKDNRRRVSFKPSNAGQSGRLVVGNRHTAELAIRARLAEDEDMGAGGGSGSGVGLMGDEPRGRVENDFRFAGKGKRIRRLGSPIPKGHGHGGPGKKKLIAGASGWFIVQIPFGHTHDRQLVCKQLHDLCRPHNFIPHYIRNEGTTLTFFVDDIYVAEVLLNADRQLSWPNGHKILIRVRNSTPPICVDEALKQKMRSAMMQLYKPDTKALDLTRFHTHSELSEVFCALVRPTLMLLAIDIMAELFPDLEALKLDENKLQLLEPLKALASKLPFLKVLHLAGNKISNVHSLDPLKECLLVDMVLLGNPMMLRARDPATYVSDVRKKFPKLLRLDNMDLPPQIGFDVADESQLPSPKASFLCNLAGADIVRQFLGQYFSIFDSESRQPLLNAYHEQAMFSLTASYASEQHLRLAAYMPFNRNILRCRDSEQRTKLLKNGRLPVVSFLSELPDTEHDLQSFGVDLSLFTPQLIMLTVTGVFREKPKSGPTNMRSFQKVLTIVPSGTGFCIKNELMHVGNCTIHQLKAAFRPAVAAAAAVAAQPSSMSATISAPVAVASTSAAAAASVALPDEATKWQMVQTMSQHSNMNLEWSRKCLEETNWDFNRAGYTFTELQKQNKIPPEAFVK